MVAILEVNLGAGQQLLCVQAGEIGRGLKEGVPCLLRCSPQPASLRVDDVPLALVGGGMFSWTPMLFAGLVSVSAEAADGKIYEFGLVISPQESKTDDDEFAEMVAAIRAFDVSLLAGVSSASMLFGKEGWTGVLTPNVQLQRLRRYGPLFADALRSIVRLPHQSHSAEAQVLPLVRVRQVHPDALRERRIVEFSLSSSPELQSIESLQVRSYLPTPTFDTPANRTLVALLRRVQARASLLMELVRDCQLQGDKEEQALRAPRRLLEVEALFASLKSIARLDPFGKLDPNVQTTSAGLTQIAANPAYQRAYRLGSLALSSGLLGEQQDQLQVHFSWGIYETWCLLAALQCLQEVLRAPFTPIKSSCVTSDLAYGLKLSESRTIEIHFQAKFPALAPLSGKNCWSLSRERYPDILLLDVQETGTRALVLDAKWRSGRGNLLEAMESAHIYHDALRVSGSPPSLCLLLLPGEPEIPALATDECIKSNGVGAIYLFVPGGSGLGRLRATLGGWLVASS